jgi:hypothetical protein
VRNGIQFQAGLPLPEIQCPNARKEHCEADLNKTRWPVGFLVSTLRRA